MTMERTECLIHNAKDVISCEHVGDRYIVETAHPRYESILTFGRVDQPGNISNRTNEDNRTWMRGLLRRP